jgi:hypothetical protein
MGADGACSLLFCAAKRSGDFHPNMPAGPRARVSRLGGFTRLSPGSLPSRAKRLPAVLARPQSCRARRLAQDGATEVDRLRALRVQRTE